MKVRACTTPGQFAIEALPKGPAGEKWIQEYINFSGYFGVHGPHVFSAAPELLEALEYAVSKYGQDGGPWNVPSDPGGWLDRARAAIAKAKGE